MTLGLRAISQRPIASLANVVAIPPATTVTAPIAGRVARTGSLAGTMPTVSELSAAPRDPRAIVGTMPAVAELSGAPRNPRVIDGKP